MINNLTDARCRVEQAQRVLSVWMEADISGDADTTMDIIGALMTLLGGVPDAISVADMRKGEVDIDITANAALGNVNQAIAFVELWLDGMKPDYHEPHENHRLAGLITILGEAKSELEQLTNG